MAGSDADAGAGATSENAPAASVVAIAAVCQPPAPFELRCSCTAAFATSGLVVPVATPFAIVASTRTATAIDARPTRTFPHASRYWVAIWGWTIVENEPSAPTSSSPAGAQSRPKGFASSATESAPRTRPLSETAPP